MVPFTQCKMKINARSTFQKLVNAVGKVENLRQLKCKDPVDALKLPKYYDNYSNIALYSGDWRSVKCDCVHFGAEGILYQELVLARIAKYDPCLKSDNDITEHHRSHEDPRFSVMEVFNFIQHVKYLSYGELSKVQAELVRRKQRSLMIPFDVFQNPSYVLLEKYTAEVKGLKKLEKVVLCVSDDNTWSVVNRLLKL